MIFGVVCDTILSMKFLFTILLVASFIGVAVFGTFGMGHMQNNGGICIAEIASGTNCPQKTDPIVFADFYLNAFKSFSLATFDGNVMNSLLFLFGFLVLVILVISSPSFFKLPRLAFVGYRSGDSFFSSEERKLAKWLALHENSPSTF